MLPRSALAAKPMPPKVDARPLLPEVMAPPRPRDPPLDQVTTPLLEQLMLVEKPEVVLAAKAAEDLRAQEGAQVLVVDGS